MGPDCQGQSGAPCSTADESTRLSVNDYFKALLATNLETSGLFYVNANSFQLFHCYFAFANLCCHSVFQGKLLDDLREGGQVKVAPAHSQNLFDVERLFLDEEAFVKVNLLRCYWIETNIVD